MNGIEIYLTVTEAANTLGITKEEVKQLVEQGVLQPYRAQADDSKYLIPSSEIERYLNKQVH